MNTPLSVDEALRLARAHARRGEFERAAGLYRAILERNPKHKKARKALKELSRSAPPRVTMQEDFNRLLQLYQEGKVDAVLKLSERLCRDFPGQPMPFNIRGAMLNRHGQFKEAIECFEHALRLEPAYADALHNLGVALEGTGRLEEALAAGERCVALNPRDPAAHTRLADVLRRDGQLDKAVSCYQAALGLDPKAADTHLALGATLREMVRPREAITAYRAALDLDPRNATAHELIGDAFVLMADLHSAITWYRDALRIEPNRARYHTKLGIALLKQGKTEEALGALNHAHNLSPGDDETKHFLNAARGANAGQAPRGYVTGLFDNYAARFDTHLKEQLGYSTPELLPALLRDKGGLEEPVARAVDMGCGTGLAGVACRELASSITGIDLSSRMLEQADKTDAYESLLRGDLVAVLQSLQGSFDLFLAADVFVYIGDLAPVLAAVAARSKQGTLLAFSTEAAADQDMELRASGRYAHGKDYVRRVAAEHGFTEVDCSENNLRKEEGEWITGNLYLMRFTG